MKEIRILALGTILVLGFAMGAQAQTQSTSENGDANTYQVGQPAQQDQGAVGNASSYEIGQPEQNTAEPEQQATPASEDPAPLGNVSLTPDSWSVPPSL